MTPTSIAETKDSTPDGKVGQSPRQMSISAALVADLVVFGVLVYAAFFARFYPDVYLRIASEDSYIEWMTFWSYLIGTALFAAAARRQHRTGQLSWFLAGISLFCLIVAMEEISWGQRLIGYQPPIYFLKSNSHQEVNFRNIMRSDLRQNAFLVVIAGYGVLLPIALNVPRVGRWLRRLAIVGPSVWLIPSFIAAFALYWSYPWMFTGEVVELMLGLGFLFTGIACLQSYAHASRRGLLRQVMPTAAAFVVVLALGTVATAWVERARDGERAARKAARIETRALMDDLLRLTAERGFNVPSQCGTHVRMYSLAEMGPLPNCSGANLHVFGSMVSLAREPSI